MEFKDIQSTVVKNGERYGKKFGITIDKEFCNLKLMEELGEFAEAVLTHAKKSRLEKTLPEEEAKQRLAHELADILGMTIVTASVYDIDLEEALQEKWMQKHSDDSKYDDLG